MVDAGLFTDRSDFKCYQPSINPETSADFRFYDLYICTACKFYIS